MKLTLRQKRVIVIQFKAGAPLNDIPFTLGLSFNNWDVLMDEIEQVLRDFMNGKFQLKPRKRGKSWHKT